MAFCARAQGAREGEKREGAKGGTGRPRSELSESGFGDSLERAFTLSPSLFSSAARAGRLTRQDSQAHKGESAVFCRERRERTTTGRERERERKGTERHQSLRVCCESVIFSSWSREGEKKKERKKNETLSFPRSFKASSPFSLFFSLSDCTLQLFRSPPSKALEKKREGNQGREGRVKRFSLNLIEGDADSLLPRRRPHVLPDAYDVGRSSSGECRGLPGSGIRALGGCRCLGERSHRWQQASSDRRRRSFDLFSAAASLPAPFPRAGRGARSRLGPAGLPRVLGHLGDARDERSRRRQGEEEQGGGVLPERRLSAAAAGQDGERPPPRAARRCRFSCPAPPAASHARGPPRRHRRRRREARERGVGGPWRPWRRRHWRERRRGRGRAANHRRPALPDGRLPSRDGSGGGPRRRDAQEDDDGEQRRGRRRGRRRKERRGDNRGNSFGSGGSGSSFFLGTGGSGGGSSSSRKQPGRPRTRVRPCGGRGALRPLAL